MNSPDISVRPMTPSRPYKVPNTGAQDYAAYMLTHTSGNKEVSKMFRNSLASREGAESEKAGVLSSLFDALSVPLYTAKGLVTGEVDNALNLAKHAGIGPGGVFGDNEKESVGKDIADLFTEGGESIAGGVAQGMNIATDSKLSALAGPIPNMLAPRVKGFADRNAPRTTNEDTLHRLGVNNKFARYGGGFALDVAMDPLTYVGGLGLLGKGKQLQKVLDLKAAVPEGGANTTRALDNSLSQIAKRESATQGGLMRPGGNLRQPPVAEQAVSRPMVQNPLNYDPVPKIPRRQVTSLMDDLKFQPRTRELERRWGKQQNALASDMRRGKVDVPSPARTANQKLERSFQDHTRAMVKAGQVQEPSGRFNVRSANQIVNDILTGKAPRYSVQAPKATGGTAAVARQVADDLIDDLMGPARVGGKFAKRNKVKEVSPGQQIALFHKLLRDTSLGEDDFDVARSMLATAEDHLITLGVQPISHEGVRVRLSDVIEATHNQIPIDEVISDFAKRDYSKMNPIVRSAIHGLAAQRSLTMSEITANLSKLSQQAMDGITKFNPIERPTVEKQIIDTSLEQAMEKGMTNKEIAAVKDLVKNIVDMDKLPSDKWVIRASEELRQAAVQGRVSTKLVDDFNRAIAEGLGDSLENLGKKVSGNKVVDSFMVRTTTWWGKGDWQNYAKDVFDAGNDNAVARAQAMKNIVKQHTPDEIKAAWRHASGAEDVSDPKALNLANFISNYMRQVLKVQEHGLGLENPLLGETSVAERSMMMMNDVNRTLKEMNGPNAFQFMNKRKARDFLQNERDYSQGSDWMKSWASYNPKDPVGFLYDIDLAMERTTKEYAFLDDFAARYGSMRQTATHNYNMNLSRIKGVWVPEDVGKQMMRVMNDLYKGGYHPKSDLMRFYSKGLRIWKTGVTIYLPSHHIRNAIGDSYLMWLAGHNDPRAFIWSRRIMSSQRTMYKDAIKRGDFDALEQFTSPEAISWASTKGTDVILNQKGVRVTADQLFVGAHQHGLLANAYAYEDIFGEAPLGEITATSRGLARRIKEPFGGKVHDQLTSAAEYREHYIRLAHFTSAVNKNLKKGQKLKESMDNAAHEVRKWHPDGRDLTFDEQRLRMLIPFYSWIRKSTPLLVQSMVTAPAKNLAYPRGMLALQQSVGTATGTTIADPYPDDQLFPEWIRSYGIAPIGDPESDNIMSRWWGNLGKNMINPVTGGKYGYGLVNPSNPFVDAGAQFLGFGPKDTAEGIWNSVTPGIKVPVELATGRDFTGAPIAKEEGGQGVLHYLSKQVPLTAPLQRVSNVGDRPREGVEGGFDNEALINMLTAAGVRGTGPYIKSAEFEARARARAKKKAEQK